MVFLGASIWLLVPVAIIVFGIRAVWISVTLPRKVPREAACGRCAYPVAGLASPQCPECGSDFRVVGISTPRFVLRWRGGYAGAIIGWTLAMLMIGAASAWFIAIFSFTSTMGTGAGGWSTGMSEKLMPKSGAVRSFELSSDQSWTGAGAMTQTVSITAVLTDGSEQTFELDPSATTYTTDDGTGALPPANFDGYSVTGWLQGMGLDTSDTRIAAEARDLTRMVDVAAQNPGTTIGGVAQTSFAVGPPKWNQSNTPVVNTPAANTLVIVGYSVAGGLFLLWVGGIVWICLRRSRLLAAGA